MQNIPAKSASLRWLLYWYQMLQLSC